MSTVIGSLGTGLLLAAYALLAMRRITLGRRYFAMNAVGALLAAAASAMLRFAPFVVLEIAWLAVAVAGFIRPPPAAPDPQRVRA